MQYLNRNCLRSVANDPNFPYLFYRNKDVATYNKKMFSLVLGDEVFINANDNLEENDGNVHCHLHISTLPLQIILKLNMLIEIYSTNYGSQDGLVNGVDGIMKAYTKTKDFDVKWIKFNDSNIGHDQEKKLAFLYIDHISKYWTPIPQITKPISSTMKT